MEFVWTTLNNRKLHLYEMGNNHIQNCIKHVYERYHSDTFSKIGTDSIINAFQNELTYRNILNELGIEDEFKTKKT